MYTMKSARSAYTGFTIKYNKPAEVGMVGSSVECGGRCYVVSGTRGNYNRTSRGVGGWVEGFYFRTVYG